MAGRTRLGGLGASADRHALMFDTLMRNAAVGMNKTERYLEGTGLGCASLLRRIEEHMSKLDVAQAHARNSLGTDGKATTEHLRRVEHLKSRLAKQRGRFWSRCKLVERR